MPRKQKANPCLGCKTKEKQYCPYCIKEQENNIEKLFIKKNDGNRRRRRQLIPVPERD